MQSEAVLHQQVTDYLKLQYPRALFRTDFAAGMKLSMGQAVRQKRLQSCRAWPDIFIAEPRGGQMGLFLELKKAGTRITLKDGSLTADRHIREQHEVLTWLNDRGYRAVFAVGFDQAVAEIDAYLN